MKVVDLRDLVERVIPLEERFGVTISCMMLWSLKGRFVHGLARAAHSLWP
jgi:hypothetical protein